MKILIIILTLGIFWRPSLSYMYKNATTLEKIEYYLSYFDSQKDTIIEDTWKSPQQFMHDKGGDCEDFAIMVYELALCIGYEPKIISMWNLDDDRDYGHAVCVIDETILFSNHTLEELTLEQYMKNHNYTEFCEYDWRVRQRYVRNKMYKEWE